MFSERVLKISFVMLKESVITDISIISRMISDIYKCKFRTILINVGTFYFYINDKESKLGHITLHKVSSMTNSKGHLNKYYHFLSNNFK